VKNPEIEIDIASIQTDDFVDAHSGCYQQTKEGCKRAGTESPRSLSGIAYLPRLTLRLAGLVCELRRTACNRVGGL